MPPLSTTTRDSAAASCIAPHSFGDVDLLFLSPHLGPDQEGGMFLMWSAKSHRGAKVPQVMRSQDKPIKSPLSAVGKEPGSHLLDRSCKQHCFGLRPPADGETHAHTHTLTRAHTHLHAHTGPDIMCCCGGDAHHHLHPSCSIYSVSFIVCVLLSTFPFAFLYF